MMAGRQPMHLLDLPPEVLMMILSPLLTLGRPMDLCSCPDHGAELKEWLQDARAVLLVHPVLHAVACPMLYRSNTFRLELMAGKHGTLQTKCLRMHLGKSTSSFGTAVAAPLLLSDGDDSASLTAEHKHAIGRLLLLVTPSARRRIRHFQLDIGRHRGWVDMLVTPVLADMILAGSLAWLSINIRYPACDSQFRTLHDSTWVNNIAPNRGLDAAMFTKPPLAGLLKLLADPDLVRSELTITDGHPRAWCKYHPKDEASTSEGVKLACQYAGAVDWLAIVGEVLDPEGLGIAALARGRV